MDKNHDYNPWNEHRPWSPKKLSAVFQKLFREPNCLPILLKFGENIPFCNNLYKFVGQNNPIVFVSPKVLLLEPRGVIFRQHFPSSLLKKKSTFLRRWSTHLVLYFYIKQCLGWLYSMFSCLDSRFALLNTTFCFKFAQARLFAQLYHHVSVRQRFGRLKARTIIKSRIYLFTS